MEDLLRTEHVIIGLGAFAAAIFAIWRLIDKAMLKMKESFLSDEQHAREQRDLVVNARFDAMEKRIQSREAHDERLWVAVEEIKNTLNEIQMKMVHSHSELSERLVKLEQSGCAPVTKS